MNQRRLKLNQLLNLVSNNPPLTQKTKFGLQLKLIYNPCMKKLFILLFTILISSCGSSSNSYQSNSDGEALALIGAFLQGAASAYSYSPTYSSYTPTYSNTSSSYSNNSSSGLGVLVYAEDMMAQVVLVMMAQVVLVMMAQVELHILVLVVLVMMELGALVMMGQVGVGIVPQYVLSNNNIIDTDSY